MSDTVTSLIKEAVAMGIELVALPGAEIPATHPPSPISRAPCPIIFLDKDILLAKYLEAQGHRLFNSASCVEICDDKALTALHCRRLPMPRTYLPPMTFKNLTPDLSYLSNAEALGFPVVVKERRGSLGEQVWLAHNADELKALTEKYWKNDLIYQEFVNPSISAPDSLGGKISSQDLRIYIVGGKITGAIKRSNDRDFRANYHLGGAAVPHEPDEKESALALAAAETVGAAFCGVDILMRGEERLLCEINSGASFSLLDKTLGTNTAREILLYLLFREG